MNLRIILIILISLAYFGTSQENEKKREISETLLMKRMTNSFQKELLNMIEAYMAIKAKENIADKKFMYRVCLPNFQMTAGIWDCTECTRNEAKTLFPFIFKNERGPRFYKVDLI